MSRGEVVVIWTCDRCGAEIPAPGGMPPKSWMSILPPQLSASGTVPISYWKDICYDCVGSYKDWWICEMPSKAEPFTHPKLGVFDIDKARLDFERQGVEK